MKRYKRKPKNLWQRVWFWFRPKIVEAEPFIGLWVSVGENHKSYLCHKDWFEANYEPVPSMSQTNMPINSQHESRQMAYNTVTNQLEYFDDPANSAAAGKLVKRFEINSPPAPFMTREEAFNALREELLKGKIAAPSINFLVSTTNETTLDISKMQYGFASYERLSDKQKEAFDRFTRNFYPQSNVAPYLYGFEWINDKECQEYLDGKRSIMFIKSKTSESGL